MKFCPRCKLSKNFSEFPISKNRKGGLAGHCKECKKYLCNNWYLRNVDTVARQGKKWRADNPDRLTEINQLWYLENKEHADNRSKMYRQNHRDYIRKYQLEYELNRIKTDLQFKLTKLLRTRLAIAIKNNQKVGSAVRDLGCSVDFLKQYLESKFLPGMSWSNHGFGTYKWHIDHIIPLDSFDLTDRKQLLNACHYTNLQPLWQEDNLRKGSKILSI